MIQFDTDGVTLFYIDATGNKISQNFMSGQPYTDWLQIRDEQLDAARVNTQAEDNYNTALSNAQVSVNAGKGGAELAPPKPTMKVVSDTGVVDELDLSGIEAVYEKELRGQPPYDPRMMTKLLVYGYCVGVYSARKIQQRLTEDVRSE